MESNEYRSIDDILNDPDLDDLIEPVEEKKKRISVNPDVQSLHEIEEWVRKNARMPQNSEDNLNERSMYHKLLGLQKKASELREYDSLGLLVEEEPTAYDKLNDEIKKDVNGGGFNSLDDVLNDDSVLFEDLDDVDPEEINFFNTTKVTRKQRNSSGANVKRNQVDDFFGIQEDVQAGSKGACQRLEEVHPLQELQHSSSSLLSVEEPVDIH